MTHDLWCSCLNCILFNVPVRYTGSVARTSALVHNWLGFPGLDIVEIVMSYICIVSVFYPGYSNKSRNTAKFRGWDAENATEIQGSGR